MEEEGLRRWTGLMATYLDARIDGGFLGGYLLPRPSWRIGLGRHMATGFWETEYRHTIKCRGKRWFRGA